MKPLKARKEREIKEKRKEQSDTESDQLGFGFL